MTAVYAGLSVDTPDLKALRVKIIDAKDGSVGTEAEHSIDTADWLANEIKNVRGVAKLFATGGDLQIALRRTRSG